MDCPTHLNIALDQAEAGMVLADDLLDSHGAVLLPQGAILTDATLASLRRRGVAHCSIVYAGTAGQAGGADGDAGATAQAAHAVPAVHEAGAATEARAALRAQQLARLRHLFRHNADHEANATLLQLLTDYRNRE